ncbi:MAG: RNA methyltransferase, partial [Rikenellaceae bacterium]
QMIRSLHQKGGRKEHGLFIIEGEKIIEEIRGSSLVVRKIYALEGALEGEDVETISPKEMERISTLTSANNSLALVEIPQHTLTEESLKGKLTLMLDEIQNPGNLGTIIRLADWFGIENIICSPTSADLYNPKVVQATMGAILRVKVTYTPLPPMLDKLQALKIPIYGTHLEGEDIYHTELQQSGVIVMGNEGRGISDEVARYISKQLYIPPYPCDTPSSESLNVAIATAIVCSEFRRRA